MLTDQCIVVCSGHMLVSWLCSCISDKQHYLYGQLSLRDFKVLIVQFCTHLLAAGVIRKLEDDVNLTAVFKVKLLSSYSMLFYCHW